AGGAPSAVAGTRAAFDVVAPVRRRRSARGHGRVERPRVVAVIVRIVITASVDRSIAGSAVVTITIAIRPGGIVERLILRRLLIILQRLVFGLPPLAVEAVGEPALRRQMHPAARPSAHPAPPTP